MSHRNWCSINNNYSDFNSKIRGTLQSVKSFIGIKAGNHFFKKFLLESADGE